MGGAWDIWDGGWEVVFRKIQRWTVGQKNTGVCLLLKQMKNQFDFCSHSLGGGFTFFLCFTHTRGNDPNLTCAYFFKRVGSTTGRSTFIVSFFLGNPKAHWLFLVPLLVGR